MWMNKKIFSGIRMVRPLKKAQSVLRLPAFWVVWLFALRPGRRMIR